MSLPSFGNGRSRRLLWCLCCIVLLSVALTGYAWNGRVSSTALPNGSTAERPSHPPSSLGTVEQNDRGQDRFKPGLEPDPEPPAIATITAQERIDQLVLLLLDNQVKDAVALLSSSRNGEGFAEAALERLGTFLDQTHTLAEKQLVAGYLLLALDDVRLSEAISKLFNPWGPQADTTRLLTWKRFDTKANIELPASQSLSETELAMCSAIAFVVEGALSDSQRASAFTNLIVAKYESSQAGGDAAPPLSGLLACVRRCVVGPPLLSPVHPVMQLLRTIAADTRLAARVRYQARQMLSLVVTDLLTLVEALAAAEGVREASTAVSRYLDAVPRGSWDFVAVIDALVARFGLSAAVGALQLGLGGAAVCRDYESAREVAEVLLRSSNFETGLAANKDDRLALAVIGVRSITAALNSATRAPGKANTDRKRLLSDSLLVEIGGVSRLAAWESSVGERFDRFTTINFHKTTFNLLLELDSPLATRCDSVVALIKARQQVTQDQASSILVSIDTNSVADIVGAAGAVTSLMQTTLDYLRFPEGKLTKGEALGDMTACCFIVSYTDKLLQTLGYPPVALSDQARRNWKAVKVTSREAADGKSGVPQQKLGKEALAALDRLSDAGVPSEWTE